jgi:hypothetical protein
MRLPPPNRLPRRHTMKNNIRFLSALAFGLLAPAAFAQQLPVLTVSMTEIDVNGAPAYGSNANAAGGGPTNSGKLLNGGNAPFGSQLTLWALATGTAPSSGFTYTFFVNGISIGEATPTPVFSFNYGLSWTPPQPGVYFFSVTASDGSHTATSIAIEFYCTGMEIVSPPPNAVLPYGSSTVIQAAASTSIGAVSRVDFFDESGLLGSSRTYPYSIIYTPPSVNPINGTHVNVINAIAYKADGTTDPTLASAFQNITMTAPVGSLPTCVISTPTMKPPLTPTGPPQPDTIPIPDYVSDPSAFIAVIVDAASPLGNIDQVELYINGVLFGVNANYPYSFQWQPSVTGTYYLTALAYDDKNNVIASTTSTTATLTPQPTTVIVGSLPSVAITNPADGGTISGGGPSNGQANVVATATTTNTDSTGANVGIANVQFFQDTNFVGEATATDGNAPNEYSVSFVPKQNLDPVSGKPIPSLLTAQATDNLGFTSTSVAVTVNVDLGGSSTTTIIGNAPAITLTSPANGASVVVNTPVTLLASAQSMNTPGNVQQVEFFVGGTSIGKVLAYPYSITWTPTNLGTYAIDAQVTDNDGNVTTSSTVNVTVTTEPPPIVNITAPVVGGTTTVSTSVTISANATATSGTISSVQFYENGISVATVTTPPYTTSFTPLSAGIYSITAIATDNAGETTTSAPVVIEALPAVGGLGTTTYFGQYQSLTDGGRFAFAQVDGTEGVYIGLSTSNGSTAFYSGIPISSGGSFSTSNLTGTVSSTGVGGTLAASQATFIGPSPLAGTTAVSSGYFTGSLSGQPESQVAAIVGADGSLMMYISSGASNDVGQGSLDSSGAFTITTAGNNTLTGEIDPTTGFITGALSGSGGGSILAAKVSGGLFSDGVMRNISTRAQVGSGGTLIAGFVVGGASPKQLLIRAVGPTLSSFGLSSPISATQLQVFSGSTVVAQNTGWSSTSTNAMSVTNADAQVGAFALPTGSADSALVGSFAPGAYTAQITGVGGASGVTLAEIYDLDAYTPFSTRKLINISTRGSVGTGANVLIAGFSINGTAPKKLLIRGAGPGLAGFGVAAPLSSPHLQLVNAATQATVRENFSWQSGNDAALVTAAEKSTGAFTYAANSADSAILIVLPPGTYTAIVGGVGTATGTALVEVYEVP